MCMKLWRLIPLSVKQVTDVVDSSLGEEWKLPPMETSSSGPDGSLSYFPDFLPIILQTKETCYPLKGLESRADEPAGGEIPGWGPGHMC